MIQHRIDNQLLVITLDNPKSLNALTLDMVKTIRSLLAKHKADPNVRAVLFCGNDRAFCAGGDIRGLYHAICDNTTDYVDFFCHEYSLNYEIHTYPKPTIAYGAGIVMGGGMGLFMACRHKIATNSTLMAMPEISIGLFPDAGASFFLNKIPENIGLFLGLTGTRLNANDAYLLGLCDVVTNKSLADIMSMGDDISHFLNTLHRPVSVNDSPLMQNFATINQLMSADSLDAVDKKLKNHTTSDDFLQLALDNYRNGSPTSAYLCYIIHKTTKTWSLKDILTMELSVAIACCQSGELKEGVRALLINKDKSPKWQYTMQTIDFDKLYAHFDMVYTLDISDDK